jgi:hypothetical protein
MLLEPEEPKMSPAQVMEIYHGWAPETQRELLGLLEESLEPDIDPEVLAELERRLERADKYPETTMPIEQAWKILGFKE